ncbi:MAG: ABC-transporter involved in LPS biosynthesis Wzm [Candidatus Scalindua rubra]|uniref:Transport permease protein n=1 Tax=Candidatus Scalindua rubra TaxID=1872076 RepID=A0A1E3XG04_9BACT|nr:MAG: ABC-transporter involved in LPS biosynthesis Wzm [Candidatus Scalindua rubra]
MFIKNLYINRELLLQLTLRQIKSRYKQSVLGVSWALIRPFGMMIVFTIIFSKFVKVPSDGIPYPIFSYCALLPWTFFSTSLNTGINSMTSSVNLIQQIYFPREIFPLSAVMASFVDFGIASGIFVCLMIFYKIQISLYILWIIPILLLQIVFTIAVSMLGAALNVFYRDIGQALVFITQLWMYACPIIYPVSVVPEGYRRLYALNPMAGIIDGYRNVIIHGIAPNWEYLLISFVITILTFFCSYKIFKRLEMRFADVI